MFLIHSPADEHLGCFHILAVVNSAAMNIGVHISSQIFGFFKYICRSGIAESYDSMTCMVTQWVRNSPVMQETQEMWVQSLSQKDPLEEGMATHSSVLAWRMPWTEKPSGLLQSIGWQSIMHAFAYLISGHVLWHEGS